VNHRVSDAPDHLQARRGHALTASLSIATPTADTLAATAHKYSVALFIPSFEIGGAESQALELARSLNKEQYDVTVISLRDDGGLSEAFKSMPSVSVITLKGRWPFSICAELHQALRCRQADVLHAFLLSTNIYALSAKLLQPSVKVILGVRDSLTDAAFGYPTQASRMKTRSLRWMLNQLSLFADLAIVNSEAARQGRAVKLRVKRVLIPNGIDTNKFRPDPSAPIRLRTMLRLPLETPIVGILANCTVYKDYPTFIRAARNVADKRPDVHFVSIGYRNTAIGHVAERMVQELELGELFHFLGERADVARLLPGMDIMCSSSVTEGFSNAIGESMACGIPCVVTDVGDSRRLLGDAGIVVSPARQEEMAQAVVRILEMDASDRVLLGLSGRHRVEQMYGVSQMVARYQAEYKRLIRRGRVIRD